MNAKSSRMVDAGGSGRNRGAGRVASRGAGHRQRRVGEELRHILAEILRNGECRDPALRDASITVTEIRISPDLRSATAYVMPLGGVNGAEIVAALHGCAGFLRGRLARGAALRYAPNLTFSLDETFDQADRIAALLARPEVERDLSAASIAGEAGDDAG
jgi:ribosome-binding factor A